jgi:hypothetical protein
VRERTVQSPVDVPVIILYAIMGESCWGTVSLDAEGRVVAQGIPALHRLIAEPQWSWREEREVDPSEGLTFLLTIKGRYVGPLGLRAERLEDAPAWVLAARAVVKMEPVQVELPLRTGT